MDQLNSKPDHEFASKQIEKGISDYGTTRNIIIIAILVVVLMVAIWVAKSMEVSHVKEEAARDTQILKVEATKHVVHSHEEHLKLLAKPFVWAIGAEIMHGNFKKVDQYMKEMVQNTHFQHIAIVDNKGTIILSTNKKHEGRPFSVIGKPSLLKSSETILENINDKVLVMASPIIGNQRRIGTLVIRYAIEPIDFH